MRLWFGLALSLVACGDDVQPATARFRKITLSDRFYAEGATFGDFDRDGITDVVAGPFWYRGPTFTEAHAIYPPVAFDPLGYSDNFFAFAHDFNRDDYPDVLVVGFPGTGATWFENPRVTDAPWRRHDVFDGVDNESPTFVDITGDAMPELVMAHGGAIGSAAPGSDPAAPWPFTAATPSLGHSAFTHGLGVGDVDGDRRTDFLHAEGINFGDGRAVRRFFGIGAQMFARDVDGDDDADVITTLAAHEYGLAWFEQRGDVFVEHTVLPESPDGHPAIFQPHALAMADIDGDGLQDIITGERFWAHVPANASFTDPASLYWFRHVRDDNGDTFIPERIDNASGVGTQLTIGLVDGDGRPDIVVANKKGAFVFLQE